MDGVRVSATSIPLAWKNLTHDPRKLLVAIIGIAFAVVLMFQQRGFNHALFDSTVAIVEELDADLILYNPSRFALSSEVRFSRDAIDVSASTPGVESANPLYLENLFARLRTAGRRARPIRVLGVDLDKDILLDRSGEILPQIDRLRSPETALMDRLSKKNYGIVLSKKSLPQSAELSGKQIEIVGLFQSGRDFAHDGNLIMSLDNFTQYFGYRAIDPLSVVDLGVVKVASNENAEAVANVLQEKLGDGVAVLTKAQFIQKEIDFWSRNTPIGVIFAIGAVMGFVVGVIICYQILANDISEHLGEFATLKAMGYGNTYFFALVIKQAVYLSLLGFLPGLICAWLLFRINVSFTGLLMQLSWDRILFVFVLTVVMCVVSGLFALRKLLAADPASLF